MLNHIAIQGRLVKDPELRRTQSGKAVTSFRIACERDYEKKTDFFDCVAWDKTAEFISKYWVKGKSILLSGSIQTREWESEKGKKILHEIIVDHAYFCGGEKTEAKPVNVSAEDFDDVDFPWSDLPY